VNFTLSLIIGLKEIAAHKLRSLLNMFGIILGVASLMAMFAITEGITRGVRASLLASGGVEVVEIIDKEPSEALQEISFLSPGRTMDDVEALRKGAPLLDLIAPELFNRSAAISRGGKPLRLPLRGVTPEFAPMVRFDIASGRMLSQSDIDAVKRVVVVGSSLIDELWPGEPFVEPIGEILLINSIPYRIIGIFEFCERDSDKRRRESGVAASNQERRERRLGGKVRKRITDDPLWWKNYVVIIPISTFFFDFRSASNSDGSPDRRLQQFNVRVSDISLFDEALEQVRTVLERTHRGIDDFGFRTREEWFDGIETYVRATRMNGSFIAAISLLVGGIGITNIMLASITERIREIGVRRAIGARRRDIFVQILVESGVIGFIGGVLGLFAAFGMVRFLGMLSTSEHAPVFTLGGALIAFSFAMVIGVLSGLYPAWKASRLDPIEALRYG